MRACREIDGLKWVKAIERPKCIPVSRPRGVKGAGLRYERSVGKAVKREYSSVLCGQWFEFCDNNGHGYCQPDVLIGLSEAIVVLECKLTECEEGRRQIDKLYRPILTVMFNKPVLGVIVSKYLTRETAREVVCDNLVSAIRRSGDRITTLHWLGKGKI